MATGLVATLCYNRVCYNVRFCSLRELGVYLKGGVAPVPRIWIFINLILLHL